MRRCTFIVELRYITIVALVEINLESFTLGSDNNIVRAIWVHFNLSVQQDTDKETVLVTMECIEGVLFQIFDHDSLDFAFIVDQFNRSEWLMIHPEHITLLPWAKMRTSMNSHTEGLEEDFDDSNGTSTEERVLARWSKQLLLVLLNERRVKYTILELLNGECASKELDVCR